MQPFKTVGIIGRVGSRNVGDSLATLEQFLARRGVELVIETRTAAMLPGTEHRVAPRATLGETCDLVIVVGGDGSLLGVARDLAQSQVPILGINRGGLGFLADVSPEQIDTKIGEVLDGKFTIEQHFLLDARVTRSSYAVGGSAALNDVVVHPGTMARMMEFRLYVDDEFVYEQRSDGLIIASPTGSTAYALSAGGPIMHPNLDAIVVVPMFPHTLTSRPLVVPATSAIKVVLGDTGSLRPQVSCDSQVDIDVRPGDEVTVRKAPAELKLVYPLGHSFYESCRSKLDWASRLGGGSR
jgi:NAD+ kinase